MGDREQRVAPRRIQRSRARGWRMPAGAIYVGRPTRWGNAVDWRECQDEWGGTDAEARAAAASIYRERLCDGALEDIRRELRGRNLACWCPLDQACHADVLLEIANA